jgi:hypothetical protein
VICAMGAAGSCEASRQPEVLWQFYTQLPENVQRLADENFDLLEADPRHPSLHFKKVGRMWSVRVGIHYRAIAVEDGSEIVWFWIGHHSEYDLIIAGRRR